MSTFRIPPLYLAEVKEHLRQIAASVHQLFDGKVNATGTVTLTVDSLTTTLVDPRIGADTQVHLVASTDSAGGEVGVYQTLPNTTKGQATLNHGDSSTADRTFYYTLLG